MYVCVCLYICINVYALCRAALTPNIYIDGNMSKPHIRIFDEYEIFAEICF